MSSICNSCAKIFERPRDYRWHLHHASNDSFKEAVASGCFMCKALTSEIRLPNNDVTELKVSAVTEYCISDQVSFKRLPVYLRWVKNGRYNDPKSPQRKFAIYPFDSEHTQDATRGSRTNSSCSCTQCSSAHKPPAVCQHSFVPGHGQGMD